MKKLFISAVTLFSLTLASQAFAANGPTHPKPAPTPDPTILGPIDPFPPPPVND